LYDCKISGKDMLRQCADMICGRPASCRPSVYTVN